jgi:3-phenylpropionate/trans-cinnamate dioxygenase ferredoxin subunit
MSRQIPVAYVDELPIGARKLAFVDGFSIVLFNVAGEVHAVDDSCPHSGASLAGGRLEGSLLRCPAHGLRFDVKSGCMPGTGGLCLKKFSVETHGERLVVVLEDRRNAEDVPGSS